MGMTNNIFSTYSGGFSSRARIQLRLPQPTVPRARRFKIRVTPPSPPRPATKKRQLAAIFRVIDSKIINIIMLLSLLLT